MKTWIVDDSNQGDFSTVAAAVAAAAAGDKIDITGGFDGVHTESDILVNKDLTITSSRYATIDAQGKGRIFTIDDGNGDNQIEVTVKNMVLTGGKADDGSESFSEADLGSAIFNRENLTVENIRAINNNAGSVGAIIDSRNNAPLNVKRSSFDGNKGGVIAASFDFDVDDTTLNNGTTLNIEQSSFTGNTLDSAIYVGVGVRASIEQSSFTGNTSESAGGAIFNDGEVSIEQSSFTGNIAKLSGGAIFDQGGKQVSIDQSSFTGNTAESSGGAIYVSSFSQAFLTEVSIEGNSAAESGGGIYNQGGTTLTIEQSTVSNNIAGEEGGGIYNAFDSKLTARETSLQSNTAKLGGGFYNQSNSLGTFINSNITSNQATIGGGIANIASEFELQNSQLANNVADIMDNNVIEAATVTIGNEDGSTFDDGTPNNLVGTTESDYIFAARGNDTISGAGGIDLLIGAEDADTFVLAPNSGTDVILDFADGEDLIGLSGGIGFNDLTLVDNTIGFNGDLLAYVINVDTTTLTSEDFVSV